MQEDNSNSKERTNEPDAERREAATSSETLEELEEDEKVSTTEGSDATTGGGSSIHSPDGAFDEGAGTTDDEAAGPV